MRLNVVTNVSDYFAQKLDYDETTYQKFRYGFGILYYTLTKTAVLIIIALALGIWKEILILLGAYTFVRLFGFGVHMHDSIKCTIVGTVLFLGGTYLGINIDLNMISYSVIFAVSLVLCFLYAPMPTAKRPINWQNRRKFKLLSMIAVVMLFLLVVYLQPGIASNLISIGVLLEMLNILPVTSKIVDKL